MKRIFLAALCILSLVPSLSSANIRIEITQGVDAGLPIGVVPFDWHGDKLLPPVDVSGIIHADLSRSGRLQPIAEESLPALPRRSQDIQYVTWREAGIEYIVVGQIEEKSRKRYQVTYELLDVLRGQAQAAGVSPVLKRGEYTVHENELRALSHHISDEIFFAITGIPGVFSTKLAYVTVKDPAPNAQDKRTWYELIVADADGFNPQPLLRSTDPIMSPAWSPDGSKLAYVSFEGEHSAIYISHLKNGHRELITRYPSINGAPAWSPDGRHLAVVLSKDGSPNIYIVDLSSKKLTQITNDRSINTEPSWVPSGRSVIFTSNRGGRPQIYQVTLASLEVRRLTFMGNYNARASLTPDGHRMAIVHQTENGFNIAVQDVIVDADGLLDTGALQVLTNSPLDESPSIAPNGDMILYSSTEQYQGRDQQMLGIVSVDGRARFRLPADSDVKHPAWSPFLSSRQH